MTSFNREDVHKNIPEIFEQVVNNHSNKIAIKTPQNSISYSELNRKANILARTILSKGKFKQKPILLIFDQGIEVLISILGVLKTNNIYVVLDPSFPKMRSNKIVDNCHLKLIITNSKYLKLAENLVVTSGEEIINIDILNNHFVGGNLKLKINSSNIASIFYTSGSTGKAKGVFRNHETILHRVWVDIQDGLNTLDSRRLSLYSPNFGASKSDIFGCLLNGSTFYPYDCKTFGLDFLLEFILQEKITVLRFPIAIFRQFINNLPPNTNFKDVKFIFLSGDKVYKKDVEKIRAIFSQECILKHQYGSSETTAITNFFVNSKTEISSDVVLAGKAVEDKQILILDENGQELAFNQVGEIAVKSRYLSSGYWRNARLTKQKYIRVKDEPKTRICLTGDLGKMLPDGFLIHLGRKDFMVKIRGYRVEIPEIEAILYSLDQIKEVVVIADVLESGNKRLIAYLVPANNLVCPTVNDVRHALAEKLPDYMIPSYYVFLDKLPLTPSGKIDRHGLPKAPSARPELNNPFVGPRDILEAEVTKIWANVLCLDQIGVEDDFLELGGNSIQAMQIVSRVIEKCQVRLSLEILFKSGTPAMMAKNIINSQIESISDEELNKILQEIE
jgi:amino acid adenylation domain-containing protein